VDEAESSEAPVDIQDSCEFTEASDAFEPHD
jgi:hypothetical protein